MPTKLSLPEDASEQQKEAAQVKMIRNLTVAYFSIVKKNIADAVPKACMYFLINRIKASLQKELLSELYTEQGIQQLLGESDDILQVMMLLLPFWLLMMLLTMLLTMLLMMLLLWLLLLLLWLVLTSLRPADPRQGHGDGQVAAAGGAGDGRDQGLRIDLHVESSNESRFSLALRLIFRRPHDLRPPHISTMLSEKFFASPLISPIARRALRSVAQLCGRNCADAGRSRFRTRCCCTQGIDLLTSGSSRAV